MNGRGMKKPVNVSLSQLKASCLFFPLKLSCKARHTEGRGGSLLRYENGNYCLDLTKGILIRLERTKFKKKKTLLVKQGTVYEMYDIYHFLVHMHGCMCMHRLSQQMIDCEEVGKGIEEKIGG